MPMLYSCLLHGVQCFVVENRLYTLYNLYCTYSDMTGEFKVDPVNRKIYRRRKIKTAITASAVTMFFFSAFTFLVLYLEFGSDLNLFVQLFIAVFIAFGVFVGIILAFGAKDIYDSLTLKITDKAITRKGNSSFCETTIDFVDIECVVEDSMGVLVIEKGCGHRFLYKKLRMFDNTAQNVFLIYIPCKMEKYDEIKKLLLSKNNKEKRF